MNDQAKEIITQMLQRVLDDVDTAADFAAQEVPIVVEQLLMWDMVESMLRCVAALAILFVWVLITMKSYYGENAWLKTPCGYNEDAVFVHALSTIILGIFFLILIDLDWLKIWIAPKLYLLEYGAALIK